MKRTAKPRIIGGMFGFEEFSDIGRSAQPFLDAKAILLANARSGIALLVELLSPARVWMPSYLCGVMIKALELGKAAIEFYPVGYDLVLPSLEWLDRVQGNDLVVLIDYFGFPCDQYCANKAKQRGAWVLEDACQALLSEHVGRTSDFAIFSPRKFLGVPDGGVLILNRELDCHHIELNSPPAEWWLKPFFASMLRREFDIYGGKHEWFKIFQEAEVTAPNGYYGMSDLSKALLRHGFDYLSIARNRIRNYSYLSKRLAKFALFPDLALGTVPLGFPIRVPNRNRIRQVLIDNKIYAPVHWEIHGIVPEHFLDSHRLSAEIMTLPCDQRYERRDMQRMASIVLAEVTK